MPHSAEEAASAALAAAKLAQQRPPPRRAAVAAIAKLAGSKRKAASAPNSMKSHGGRARSTSAEAEQQQQQAPALALPEQQQQAPALALPEQQQQAPALALPEQQQQQQQWPPPPQQQRQAAEVHILQQQVLLLEHRLRERERECAQLRNQLHAVLAQQQRRRPPLQRQCWCACLAAPPCRPVRPCRRPSGEVLLLSREGLVVRVSRLPQQLRQHVSGLLACPRVGSLAVSRKAHLLGLLHFSPCCRHMEAMAVSCVEALQGLYSAGAADALRSCGDPSNALLAAQGLGHAIECGAAGLVAKPGVQELSTAILCSMPQVCLLVRDAV